MGKKTFWISILAVIISFIGGFLLANALNRAEMDALRAENGRLKTSPAPTGSETDLSADEIKQRIAEADKNPDNFSFQKNLGLALYRYAAMKQDSALLGDTSRILERAHNLNPKDYEILVALGNLHFDIGYFNKDNRQFQKAREFYENALSQRPADVDVRTDYGLTYFLENPPQNEKAIAEFQKSLAENPKHEKTLQFLTQAFLKTGKKTEAENTLAELKKINPNAPTLAEVETQISQAGNTPQTQ
jgi:tetratricopeptide (TPR) repeat protein